MPWEHIIGSTGQGKLWKLGARKLAAYRPGSSVRYLTWRHHAPEAVPFAELVSHPAFVRDVAAAVAVADLLGRTLVWPQRWRAEIAPRSRRDRAERGATLRCTAADDVPRSFDLDRFRLAGFYVEPCSAASGLRPTPIDMSAHGSGVARGRPEPELRRWLVQIGATGSAPLLELVRPSFGGYASAERQTDYSERIRAGMHVCPREQLRACGAPCRLSGFTCGRAELQLGLEIGTDGRYRQPDANSSIYAKSPFCPFVSWRREP